MPISPFTTMVAPEFGFERSDDRSATADAARLDIKRHRPVVDFLAEMEAEGGDPESVFEDDMVALGVEAPTDDSDIHRLEDEGTVLELQGR